MPMFAGTVQPLKFPKPTAPLHLFSLLGPSLQLLFKTGLGLNGSLTRL